MPQVVNPPEMATAPSVAVAETPRTEADRRRWRFVQFTQMVDSHKRERAPVFRGARGSLHCTADGGRVPRRAISTRQELPYSLLVGFSHLFSRDEYLPRRLPGNAACGGKGRRPLVWASGSFSARRRGLGASRTQRCRKVTQSRSSRFPSSPDLVPGSAFLCRLVGSARPVPAGREHFSWASRRLHPQTGGVFRTPARSRAAP
jgi:hypothetical protein